MCYRVSAIMKDFGCRPDTCYRFFANGLAIERAHSMKRCPIGFNVRFLSVMIPVCWCVVGSSRRSFLIDARFSLNLSVDAETTARKRPVAANLIFILLGLAWIVARGGFKPFAR